MVIEIGKQHARSHLRGITAQCLEQAAFRESLRCVESQQFESYRAHFGARANQARIQLKMFGPAVPSGMEQPHDFAALPTNGGDIGSFTAVAKNTCVSQVF